MPAGDVMCQQHQPVQPGIGNAGAAAFDAGLAAAVCGCVPCAQVQAACTVLLQEQALAQLSSMLTV